MRKIFFILVFVSLITSCINKNIETNKPIVFTSIMPQKYLADEIAGDKISVEVMVLPGKNPATYEPTAEQMIKLGSAEMFFTIGVPFEKAFIPKLKSSMKTLKIINVADRIKKRSFANDLIIHDLHSEHDEDGEHHDHEDGDEPHDEDDEHHDHSGDDPHVWLNPQNMQIMAKEILNNLIKFDEKNKDYYEKNYKDLEMRLKKIDNELEITLKEIKGKTILLFHPAFGYFTDRYGLKQLAIETGGKEVESATLVRIIEHAKENSVKVVFVQPEFSKKSANAIAKAINGRVVIVKPLEYDYILNLKSLAEDFKKDMR